MKWYFLVTFIKFLCIFLNQIMPQGLSPSVQPATGVFLSGLQLKNASWDSTVNSLSDTASISTGFCSFPVLWATPRDKSVTPSVAAKNVMYNCPLYSARHSDDQSDSTMVWMIPLPSLQDPNIWSQCRTALTLTTVLK